MEECEAFQCFDCAATNGECMWNPQVKKCVKPETYLDGLRWWQWFEYCEDEKGFCKTNGKTHTSFAQGQLTK